MCEKYEKEYFIGILLLQTDLDVLKRALQLYKGYVVEKENKEKANNLLELIEAQERAQKNWDDNDPETETLKKFGIAINLMFKKGKEK